MKRVFYIVLVLLLAVSCYDDKSTLQSITFPTVVADHSAEQSYLTANYAQDFSFSPKLCYLNHKDSVAFTENDYALFDYQWQMQLVTGSDTTLQVIGSDRSLTYNMLRNPSASTYRLILYLSEKRSGVVNICKWDVKVNGVYGNGLLVVESADGLTSDLSLIMSRPFNNDIETYDGTKILRNIFSKANGENMDGVVSSINFLENDKVSLITAVISGKSLYQINPQNLNVQAKNTSTFYFLPRVFAPQFVISDNWDVSILINDGKVVSYSSRYGCKYSSNDVSSYNVFPILVMVGGPQMSAMVFDKHTHQFLRYYNNTGSVGKFPTISGNFDITTLTDAEPIFGTSCKDAANKTIVRWVMKRGSKFHLYDITFDYHSDKQDADFYGKTAYNMDGCPEFNSASTFASSRYTSDFYYGVGNKVYGAALSTSSPTATVQYTCGNGEQITHMALNTGKSGQTTWSDNPDGTPKWVDSNDDNQLTVVTYNQSTGKSKIYVLPIQYQGAAGLAPEKYFSVYEGFNRIVAISQR